MKHTPGPWSAVHSDPAEGVDCWWIVSNAVGPNMEKEVATVSGGYPHDTHEANANLIAAAPDLLAAAKCALSLLSGLGVTVGPNIGMIRDAVRKALPSK
jgi:hypothetical protein